MMKQDTPTRVIVIPEDLHLLLGRNISYCRELLRKWKRQEGLSLEQYIVVDVASKKTGIPKEEFIKVMK